jgi:hypothetical protein
VRVHVVSALSHRGVSHQVAILSRDTHQQAKRSWLQLFRWQTKLKRLSRLKSYIEGITLRYQVVWGTQRGGPSKSSRTPVARGRLYRQRKNLVSKAVCAKHATGRFDSACKAAKNTLAQ